MIYRLDHLALSCTDLDSALTELRLSGYEPRFVEEELPNRTQKRPYLRNYEPVHDIAYCEATGEIPIELTCHRTPLTDGGRSYIPTIHSLDADSIVEDGTNVPVAVPLSRSRAGKGVECGTWKPFGAPVCRPSDATGGSTDGISVAVEVSDVAGSVEFWTGALGFVREKGDAGAETGEEPDTFSHLLFTSPLQDRALRLVLCPSERSRGGHLDDAGFPCLAFLSSSLAADRERAVRCGATRASDPFSLKVAGRELTVSVVEGPGGELVELIHMES